MPYVTLTLDRGSAINNSVFGDFTLVKQLENASHEKERKGKLHFPSVAISMLLLANCVDIDLSRRGVSTPSHFWLVKLTFLGRRVRAGDEWQLSDRRALLMSNRSRVPKRDSCILCTWCEFLFIVWYTTFVSSFLFCLWLVLRMLRTAC